MPTNCRPTTTSTDDPGTVAGAGIPVSDRYSAPSFVIPVALGDAVAVGRNEPHGEAEAERQRMLVGHVKPRCDHGLHGRNSMVRHRVFRRRRGRGLGDPGRVGRAPTTGRPTRIEARTKKRTGAATVRGTRTGEIARVDRAGVPNVSPTTKKALFEDSVQGRFRHAGQPLYLP
jgi:hypothetical protein